MSLSVEIVGFDDLVRDAERIGANAPKLMKAAITNSVNKVQSEARSRAPHRTGTLQRSILTSVDYPIGSVEVEEKYGQWVENGTGVYAGNGRIVPKKAKALRWNGAGGVVFARSIKGMKGRPFFKPGVEMSADYIAGQFVKVMEKITAALAEKGY